LVPHHPGVDALEEAAHLSHGPDGDELDPVLVLQRLHLLARLQPQCLADLAGDDHLELGGDGHDRHAGLIDMSIVQRYVDRYGYANLVGIAWRWLKPPLGPAAESR